MKNHMISLLLLVSLLSVSRVSAETAELPVKVETAARMNVSIDAGYALDINHSDFSLTNLNLNGFAVGAMFDYQFKSKPELGVGIGFNFTGTYHNYEYTNSVFQYSHDIISLVDQSTIYGSVKENIRSYTYQIPIRLSYTLTKNDWAIKVYTGPKINFASSYIDASGFNGGAGLQVNQPYDLYIKPIYLT